MVFGVIGDADEAPGRRGNDLFAGESATTPFDEAKVRIDFVGAVDVDRDVASVVEIQNAQTQRLEPLGSAYAGGYVAFNGNFCPTEGVDKVIAGGTGADSDDHSWLNVIQRCLSSHTL